MKRRDELKCKLILCSAIIILAINGCSNSPSTSVTEGDITEQAQISEETSTTTRFVVTETFYADGVSTAEPTTEATEVVATTTDASESYTYTFEKCDPDEVTTASSKICNVYDYTDGLGESLFLGQVKTLFGEPDYMTMDNENMFSCIVKATDEDGNVLYLDIYYGPTGSAIGGDDTEESELAAEELKSLIKSAEPTDYEWVSYYMDIPVKVEMGVVNGKPYRHDEILNLTDEEWIELSEQVYGF